MVAQVLSKPHRGASRAAQSGRTGLPSPYAIERGQARFENWAEWALSSGIGVGYPKQSAFARLYQPEAGDVWDGLSDAECKANVDSDDAERVERFVRELGQPHRSVVKSFYLGMAPPFMAAQKFGLKLRQYYEVLDEAAGWLGAKPTLAR